MTHTTPSLVDAAALQEAHSTIESAAAMLPPAPARIIVLALARLRDAIVPMPSQPQAAGAASADPVPSA